MDNKKLFLAMTRRRVACPQVTQQLWDSIGNIKYQRQVPNLCRISRYMLRVHSMTEDEVKRQLNHCIRDGLIRMTKKTGTKGAQTGVEQDTYSLPNDPVDRDDYDWYCFECHSVGDVICCTACYRVYHAACIPPEEVPDNDVKNTFLCQVCKICTEAEKENAENPKMKKKMLNKLLSYICARLTGRLPEDLMSRKVLNDDASATDGTSSNTSQGHGEQDDDDGWRSDYLIYRPIGLADLESKTEEGKYASLEAFRADLQTLVHNVVIYHGVDNVLSEVARQMLADCIYDIGEIERCPDCYYYSNEKKNKHWFCQPCRPPHELVYAKQKSFPYWPAKVIKLEGDKYDVRFFGSDHERAVISKNCIQPISATVNSLKVKPSASWNKACEEMKFHQKLLEKAASSSLSGSVYDFEPSLEEETKSEESKVVVPKTVKRKSYRPVGRPPKKPKLELPASPESPPNIVDGDDEENDNPELESSLSGSHSNSSENLQSPLVGKDGLSQVDMVSSSCQEPRHRSIAVQAARSRPKQDLTKAALTKLQREFASEKETAIAEACKELQEQHAEELTRIKAEHAAEISDIKLKQWCYNCEKEAIYHCCWNTAYCSIQCQQDHWMTEHKPHCRRKR